MRTVNFPSPEDLEVGEKIEVCSPNSSQHQHWNLLIDSVSVIEGMTYVSGDADNGWGRGFTFTYDSKFFAWRRPEGVGRPTLRSYPAVNPVRYGATCQKCNEHYEHAEWRSRFVCYGCKVQM